LEQNNASAATKAEQKKFQAAKKMPKKNFGEPAEQNQQAALVKFETPFIAYYAISYNLFTKTGNKNVDGQSIRD
jgi:hypothetical protein